MKTCTEYLDDAKAALGDAAMSDAELGRRLGYRAGNISRARVGVMPDTIAIAVAKAIGIEPGEVLLVARAEREPNGETKRYLAEWTQRALAIVPPIKVAPEVIVRGGRKIVPLGQEWRKRSETRSELVRRLR